MVSFITKNSLTTSMSHLNMWFLAVELVDEIGPQVQFHPDLLGHSRGLQLRLVQLTQPKIKKTLFMVFAITIRYTFAKVVFPSSPCFVEDQACDIGDNLDAMTSNVLSVEMCREICYDNPRCSFFSYYGSHSFPFHETCMIFSSCSLLHPCDDCQTEDSYCYRSCGDRIEGSIGNNLVELRPNVNNETECKFICQDNSECVYYTYHDQDDSGYPKVCLLLSSLEQPLTICENCTTSPVSCSNSMCGFIQGAHFQVVAWC